MLSLTNLLPGKRYVLRELLPRAVLLTATFKWIMPATLLFTFKGGIAAAAVFGVAFTAMFSLLGAYLAGWAPMADFLERHAGKWWLHVINSGVVILLPAAALALAATFTASTFTLNWLYGPWLGTIILNIACVLTHDYSGADSSAQGTK